VDATSSAVRPRRVLVVDDEPGISELLAATLRLVEFQVRKAHSGREALAALAEFDPDLILLDVMLPDLDGFELAQRLRRHGRNVPILFLTARHAPEDRVAGLTAGGDDYVTKPFSLEEVVLRVRAILRRYGHARAETGDGVLRFADLELDEDAHEVRRAASWLTCPRRSSSCCGSCW
jgi:two-component system OmpR family response regulator